MSETIDHKPTGLFVSRMAFDSVKNLRSFLLILIFLTLFVLLNMVWSTGYLYAIINVGRKASVYYNTGNKNYEKTESNAVLKSKTNFRLQRTSQTSVFKSFSLDPTNQTSRKSFTVRRTNQTHMLNFNQSENTALATTRVEPTNRPDTCINCFQHHFKYIIQNENICNPSTKLTSINSTTIELVVLVFTVHNHFKQREVIRKTWLSVSHGNTGLIRHAFLLGDSSDRDLTQKVEKENEEYHDIIKESFVDAYKNLTYKTIMGFKWVTRFCSNARFVMKTDDDMYVNLPSILKVLEKEKNSLQTSVSGACNLRAGPIRDSRSKWYASVRSYPHNTYPGFCSGTGYVTSRVVAEKIFEVSKHVPFFYLEDVYISLCVKKLGFKLRPLPGFHSYRTKLDPCEMQSDRILTSHQVPTDFLLKIQDAKC